MSEPHSYLPPPPPVDIEWRRLDRRMIAVDIAQVVVSTVPLLLIGVAFGNGIGSGGWPLIGAAAFGVFGAVADVYRWLVTRYRITPEVVELRTGLLVRQERSVRRDRIRSVDVHAKLRHRVGGLRVISIGAGQQSAAKQSALALDAVSIADAELLRNILLERRPNDAGVGAAVERSAEGHEADSSDESDVVDRVVITRFEPRWVLYNLFNIWAYVMAAGLLWGAYWLLPTFGIDLVDLARGIVDWDELGPVASVALGAVVVTIVGVVGMAAAFFLEYSGFELDRVEARDGTTSLRTRRGLLTTREVNRDDERLRGAHISEPLAWRWLGVTDTSVITTGLSMWSVSQPSSILPRGPKSVALRAVTEVLDTAHNPMDAELRAHPKAALRRRCVWALMTSIVVVGVTASLGIWGPLPLWSVPVSGLALPVLMLGAVIAFRALGHAVSGDYLVVRSGLMARATAVLRRDAVSTVVVRESVLQRRLGLLSVGAMTSAGWGGYDAIDLDAGDAIDFADDIAPGLLASWVARSDAE